MSVTGCGTSNNIGLGNGVIPRLDPRDEAPCPDPGVEGTYAEALADNRVALADCRNRHQNVVDAYNDLREEVPPKK